MSGLRKMLDEPIGGPHAQRAPAKPWRAANFLTPSERGGARGCLWVMKHPRLAVTKKGRTGFWKDLPIPALDLSEVRWARRWKPDIPLR